MTALLTRAARPTARVVPPERPPKNVKIRRLEPREHLAYRTLRLECLKIHPEFFGTTYAEAAATRALPFERFIWKRSQDNVMFGAFIDEELTGICGFQREQRERTRHRGELVQLYVRPRAARQGIGTKLIAAVLKHAFDDLRMMQVVLSVAANNDAAVKAYHRAGFREYGWLERHFCSDAVCDAQYFMVYEC
jgi:RimJ/RimL family protein N-acetyltransferase